MCFRCGRDLLHFKHWCYGSTGPLQRVYWGTWQESVAALWDVKNAQWCFRNWITLCCLTGGLEINSSILLKPGQILLTRSVRFLMAYLLFLQTENKTVQNFTSHERNLTNSECIYQTTHCDVYILIMSVILWLSTVTMDFMMFALQFFCAA